MTYTILPDSFLAGPDPDHNMLVGLLTTGWAEGLMRDVLPEIQLKRVFGDNL